MNMIPNNNSPKNWTEDYQHENGRYICHCKKCNEHFFGYKRRNVCKECALKPHPTTLPSDEEIRKYALQKGSNVAETWNIEDGAKWMRSLCEAKLAEMEKYKSLVIELAEWSRKYPRDRIYSMRKIKMDDELIALENKAKELTTTP